MGAKYFVWALMLFCSIAKADVLDRYIQSLSEQDRAVQWIASVTNGKVVSSSARAIVADSYANAISKDLSPRIVLAIMNTESNFKSNVRSIVGAVGIMQVWPKWHRDKLKGRNAANNKVSTEVGTTILQDCFNKNDQNTYRSLNCYSGSGGRKYYKKVMGYQIDLINALKTKGVLVADI